jgi:hypothetical protein
MKVYVLFYENESGDKYVDAVLGYKPTEEDLVAMYEDSDDIIKDDDGNPDLEEGEPDFGWGDSRSKRGWFCWHYMTIAISEEEVLEK